MPKTAAKPCWWCTPACTMICRISLWSGLWPEEGEAPRVEFDPLAGYTLRIVDSMNAFREKINILEHGLGRPHG